MKKELDEALGLGKRIVPCKLRSLDWDDIKWDLGEIQGVEFDDKWELAEGVRSQNKKRNKGNG